MWGIIFYMFFGEIWATEGKKINGKILTWETREEAEAWATINCGPNLFEAVKIKKEGCYVYNNYNSFMCIKFYWRYFYIPYFYKTNIRKENGGLI